MSSSAPAAPRPWPWIGFVEETGIRATWLPKTRAYADLEDEGVLLRHPAGGMTVAAGADVICRVRLQDDARRRLRQAVRQARDTGLPEGEIYKAVEQAMTEPAPRPLAPAELHTAIKKAPRLGIRAA